MMDNSDAFASIEKPSSDISQETTLNAGKSQGEFVEIDVEEPTICIDLCESVPIVIDIEKAEEPSPIEYSALLQATRKGHWQAAKAFLDKHEDCVRACITEDQGTVLHNAVVAQHTIFIEELLNLLTPVDLKLRTKEGLTALHIAAQSGIVSIAKQLVKKNNEPLLMYDFHGNIPLWVALHHEHKNMVSFLLSVTPLERLTVDERTRLLLDTIHYDMYDIALTILKMDPLIAIADTECVWTALMELAQKPFAIGGESQLPFWKIRLNSRFRGIFNKALMKTLAHQLVQGLWKMARISENRFSSNLLDHPMLIFEAAKAGNVEFIIILVSSYPGLIRHVDENNMNIFHIAILYRHANVFNLIYEIGENKGSLASYTNLETEENILHLVGKLPPSNQLNTVSGAALQMQRELLWFKEIKKIVPPSYANMKNINGKTPKEVFTDEHTNLQKDGEKWMKDTANYCMLVATLIATVIFAAAFTVPGGNNQEIGTPIFLKSKWFIVFFISDAISLCSSSTSIVIFLSILTSRYTEEDFFKSLPSKLVFGLATLFISMAGMMVAFSATCFLMYSGARAWAPIVVITSASIPVTSFVLLHRKLWVDTYLSTYKPRFLFRPYKGRLF